MPKRKDKCKWGRSVMCFLTIGLAAFAAVCLRFAVRLSSASTGGDYHRATPEPRPHKKTHRLLATKTLQEEAADIADNSGDKSDSAQEEVDAQPRSEEPEAPDPDTSHVDNAIASDPEDALVDDEVASHPEDAVAPEKSDSQQRFETYEKTGQTNTPKDSNDSSEQKETKDTPERHEQKDTEILEKNSRPDSTEDSKDAVISEKIDSQSKNEGESRQADKSDLHVDAAMRADTKKSSDEESEDADNADDEEDLSNIADDQPSSKENNEDSATDSDDEEIETKNSKHATTLGPLEMKALSEDALKKYIPDTLASSVKCQEPDFNRSCVFSNLYYYDGNYHVLVMEGTNLPPMTMSMTSKHGGLVSPHVKRFRDIHALNDFVNGRNMQLWKGATLLYNVMWHHNIGHALFDGLYPAYVAACKFGLGAVPFRSVVGLDPSSQRFMAEDIIEEFSGGGMKNMRDLGGKSIRMEVAVMGSRNMGQRHMNPDIALHGGRDMLATRKYRDRLYVTHGIAPESDKKQAIIIHNRRFSDDEQVTLRSIKEVYGMTVEFLDWGSVKGFANQLKKLRKVAVHVSSIGTGQMYKPFLQDGSVDVSLGSLEAIRQSPFPMFMEQYMAEGSPYIRTLYYDSAKRLCGIQKEETTLLIGRAIKLFHGGFDVPVPPGENLSPEGKIFRQLCQQMDCKDILSSMNPEMGRMYPGICMHDAWVEFVVYEQGGWHPQGWEGQHCPLNRQKLKAIKETASGLAPEFPAGAEIMCVNGLPRVGSPCRENNGKRPSGNLPPGTKLLTIGDVRNNIWQCFEIMSHRHGLRLAVSAEDKPFPASQAFPGGPHEKKVSQFRIVPALTKRKDAISLESCKNAGHYLRHNQHNLIVEKPVAPNDAIWLLPHDVGNEDDCINIRAAISTNLKIVLSPNQAAAIEAGGDAACLRMRAPGTSVEGIEDGDSDVRSEPEQKEQEDETKKGNENDAQKEQEKENEKDEEKDNEKEKEKKKRKKKKKKSKMQCTVNGTSDATKVVSMADNKPCDYIPTRVCDKILGDANVGEHGVCFTPDLKQDFKDETCLVYGIGVADDWEFEKAMARKGCEVHAFDPTIDHPPPKEKSLTNLHFHKWGLAGKTENGTNKAHKVAGTLSGKTSTKQPMLTVEGMMEKLGHVGRRLTVFKVDCEGCEWEALSAVSMPLWHRIDQISFETHFSDGLMLDSSNRVKKAADVATALRAAGFTQWRTSSREGWPWHRRFLPELKEAGIAPGLCCRLSGYMRTFVTWGSARNECFEISEKKRNNFVSVGKDDESKTKNVIMKKRSSKVVSVFHIVDAVNGAGAPAFSLQSCRDKNDFLLRSDSKLVVGPLGPKDDGTWTLGSEMDVTKACIKFKSMDAKYQVALSKHGAELSEDAPQCIELRKSSLRLTPPGKEKLV